MAEEKKKKWNIGVEEENIPASNTFTEQPQTLNTDKQLNRKKKSGKIVLISENYIVVDINGNGQWISGKFEGKKVGDIIEVDS